jgi:recombination protein RecA
MPDEIDALVKALTNKYGVGSAYKLGDPDIETDVKGWTSTGSESINGIIGRPGVPDGRITLIIGNPSAGKTTGVIHLMKECQKRGGVPIYLKSEEAFDPERAARIGLDLDRVIITEPDTTEDAFEEIKTIVENTSGEKPIMVVWDTFSATPTRAEVFGGTKQEQAANLKAGTFAETDAHQGEIAGHARIVSNQMRILRKPLDQKNVTLVIVLQSKENIDVTWGSGTTWLAERPWYFYSSVLLEFKKAGNIGTAPNFDGIKSEVYVRKNKVAPPFRKCYVDCYFDKGFSELRNTLDVAAKANIIGVKGGGWFTATDAAGKQFNFAKKDWEDVLKKHSHIAELVRGLK